MSLSDSLLSELDTDTQSSIDRIEKQSKSSDSIIKEIDEIGQQIDETTKIQEKSERDSRQKILKARLETLQKSVRDEEKDLSQAVLGLNALMTAMGTDYENLTKPSQAEIDLVARAENRLVEANKALEIAKQAWFFRGSKVEAAETEINAAKQGIIDSKSQAANMARQRLMSASMADSLQEFMFKVQRTIEIMEARKKAIEIQIAAVTNRKSEAFKVKEEAARKLEEFDQKLNSAEQTLQLEEENLKSLVNGSQEYVAQENKVSNLRADVESIRGSRNTALVLFQSKERFAAELEVHQKAQMKLRDNQRSWITLLKSDTQERVVTFKSRLEAMKAMSDQDVASNLDKVGVKIDSNNVEYMAGVGSASDTARMEMIENQPERMAKITRAAAAQAEAQAVIREREAEAIKEFRDKYGIDPMDTSFFSYQGEKKDEPSASTI